MAIYHLTVTTGTRSGGQSAKAKSDYINREGRYAHDADEVMHRISGNMPEWVEEESGGGGPKDYWNLADIYERANGRLYKEVQFSLPKELDESQMVELAESFARSLTEDEKLPYSLAIHRGMSSDSDNPHCHLMISERVNDGVERDKTKWFKRANTKQPGEGGAKKTTSLMPKAWLYDVREQWAEMANEALRGAGLEEQIDHRSYKNQGVQTVPLHFGRAVLAMQDRGIETDRQAEYVAAFAGRQSVEELKDELNRADAEIQQIGGGSLIAEGRPGRGVGESAHRPDRSGIGDGGSDARSDRDDRPGSKGTSESHQGRSISDSGDGPGKTADEVSGGAGEAGSQQPELEAVGSDDPGSGDRGGSLSGRLRDRAKSLLRRQRASGKVQKDQGRGEQLPVGEKTSPDRHTQQGHLSGSEPKRGGKSGSIKPEPPKKPKPKPRKRKSRGDEGWER